MDAREIFFQAIAKSLEEAGKFNTAERFAKSIESVKEPPLPEYPVCSTSACNEVPETNGQQALIVMQGPASAERDGLAKAIASMNNAVVLSTNDFFYDQYGHYRMDLTMVSNYQRATMDRCIKALSQGQSIVLNDSNLSAWEPKPCVEHAISLGIQVHFVRVTNNLQKSLGIGLDVMDELTLHSVLATTSPWAI